MSRRSRASLSALGFVAAANGLLLALSLYGLLAALLHLVGDHAPGIGWGVVAGAVGAGALLSRSFIRAAQTRRLLYGRNLLDFELPQHDWLVDRLREMTEETSLPVAPSLRLVGGALPNAYAVSSSAEEAAIVLTEGLLERLPPAEQDAVVAHELAQVEAEDVTAVGVADAIAVTIEELSRLKGRFLWGPREIFLDIRPFLLAMVGAAILDALLPKNSRNGWLILLFLLLMLGMLRALWRAALLSWRGLAQLVLLGIFFGPLTLVEWILAPPTAFALSRLVSRDRVLAADERAAELAADPGAMAAALKRLEGVEYSGGEPFWADLRFSLFVVPRAQTGYRAWRERVFSTHPPVAARAERLRRLTQDGSRAEKISHRSGGPLEQSG
jgi:Zn-dependent protease with chaperone function